MHDPVMIRLGSTIRKAMGYKGGLYDLVAKIAGLPSDRHLRRINVSNSNDPDGIMHRCCQRAEEIFVQQNPGADMMDLGCHTIVSFDAMHMKTRFGISRNTNRLVGMADDAFDEDVLLRELTALEKNTDAKENAEAKLPDMANHFLVMIATTWSTEGKIQFLVGRWGLKTIIGPWLVQCMEKVIMTLAFYGFIVNTIA